MFVKDTTVAINGRRGITTNLESVRSNPPTNMSVEEASLYIGIAKRSLREKIANREIKHVRIGRRIILRRVDLDAYLESLSVSA